LENFNFTPNERPYDVTKTGAFLKKKEDDTAEVNNNHTAIGFPHMYENQVVGKALYGINLQ